MNICFEITQYLNKQIHTFTEATLEPDHLMKFVKHFLGVLNAIQAHIQIVPI